VRSDPSNESPLPLLFPLSFPLVYVRIPPPDPSLSALPPQNPYDPGAAGGFGDEGYDFDNSASYNMNVNSASVGAGLPTKAVLGRPMTGAAGASAIAAGGNRMGMGTAMGRGMMGTAAGMPLGTGMKPPGTGVVGVDGTRPMTSMQGPRPPP